MNSGRHFDHFTFELLVLECCVIPIFWVLRCVESIYAVIFSNQGHVQGQM